MPDNQTNLIAGTITSVIAYTVLIYRWIGGRQSVVMCNERSGTYKKDIENLQASSTELNKTISDLSADLRVYHAALKERDK